MDKKMFNKVNALEREMKGEKPMKEKTKKKLKSVKKKRAKYQITLTQFKIFLFELICAINGFDKDDYLYHDGLTMKPKFKFDKLFKELSLLKYDKEEKDDVNSLQFRGRFATKILIYFFKNIDDIIDVIAKDSNKDTYQFRYGFLNDMIKKINKFVITYLSKEYNYREHLQRLIEYMYITERRNKEAIDVTKTFEVQSQFVKRACKTKEYDEDLMVNNIIKLAYVMATNKMNVKKCPEYEEGITAKDYMRIKDQIQGLGHAILKRREKEKTPALYKCFTKAMPLYYSKYPDINEDLEVNVGTKALVYLKVLIDDPYVDRYIDKMIA